ncbi:2-keto-4-pentenoate hydratase/2-oxohepta-3-ene-1,7-dioic acid hydratase (catechol pathway) [Pseudonocardia thermophila]|uniref:2-keto-4-pentenoate hydratase/2-oxohepta-3-ene-1,7-dioic acid hydratase (Catechol pathway) n=1 Tax=Pseudonocardia thermophila TaxID=1848 RepID=A0A1M6WPX0_PSETH|nr:fumarylacetoacetate hydrolase family protein [Pseudonocardia thermophila]SHK95787.1 2-keto-4-pentenoate hydratase/2-oxohepta-3-ene-1,7-dioic acid hydratase (catechol pathway) [Pseudonocardia thermophila]
MRLLRVGPFGRERPVVMDDQDLAYDLTPICTDIDPSFFASAGIERTRTALRAGALSRIDITGARIGSPLRNPGVIICIGMNYAAHAAESGAEPPSEPVIFYKPPNTLVGPNDAVLIPPGAEHLDWEVELGVVIGRRTRYLRSAHQALDHVAGYVLSNDVSERHYQLERSGGQWSKGKSFETFNPCGPWITTPDLVADPQRLRLRSYVNGELRQDSTTADMIFSVAEIIFRLSQFMVLEPGDLVNTGTPEGVALSGRFPYLSAGDEIAMEIDGLGAIRQRVTPATSNSAPELTGA